MAKFTTRVVLHGVEESDTETYDKLHEAMEKAGFLRKIFGSDDKWYDLPPAEYNLDADLTCAAVRDKARAAANSVWKDNGVLTTEGVRQWIGLKPAK
ncbi:MULTISPECIES: DUF2622 domain-containing protein [Burkholderia]|uniref:DUF2622 domain-containing protein n=1 Tax=Burkholderia TaxID=32008 RepID=UPI0011B2635D|nr:MULTISPECIES: DUF2622 domain-containing protein [Burkholderia]QTP32602.1 hypothetical protein B7759_01175 [Burkholderia glumae]